MRSSTLVRAAVVGGTALSLSLGGAAVASAANACDINCTIDEAGTYQEEKIIRFVPNQNHEE
jgi:hypothetical protein